MHYRDLIFDRYLSCGFEAINTKDYDRSAMVYDLNYQRLFGSDKNHGILEIGCGMGHFLYYLSKKGYRDFLGVDVGREQIEHCRKNITEKVQLVDDIFSFLQSYRKQYDLVVMNDVIEHFNKEEITRLLPLIFESLKRNGRLIIKTPNMGSLFAASSRYIDFTHEVGFSELSLTQVLLASGYKNVKCYEEKIYISSPIKRIIFEVLYRIYRRTIKTLLLLERPGDNYPLILSKNLIAVGEK